MLGLIFLRYVDFRFSESKEKFETEGHIEYVANIVKLYRGDEPTFEFCDKEQFLAQFPDLIPNPIYNGAIGRFNKL